MTIKIIRVESDVERFVESAIEPKADSGPTESDSTPPVPVTKDTLISARIAQEHVWAFSKKMRQALPGAWQIKEAGSIRRGLDWVHDIDIVILLADTYNTPENRKSISQFIKDNWDWTVHIDWRFADSTNIGAMILYLTGDSN